MGLITIKQQKDFCLTANVRNHTLVLDTPRERGGMNVGPTCVELFATSVGACMAVNIVKYCKAAKLPHDGLSITLDFQVARDPMHVASITANIELPANFPADRIAAVKRAAEQCIVKNTLGENISVDVEILAGVT